MFPFTISGLGHRSLAHLLIAHFRSFQKSNWAIACSFALLKRANDRTLFLALFAKEWMSDCAFFALCKSDRSFALSKRVTKRGITLLLFQKERKSKNEQKMSNFPQSLIFCSKREQSLIFKMSGCPTLLFVNFSFLSSYLCVHYPPGLIVFF